jgi:integrase/recombinase XerD
MTTLSNALDSFYLALAADGLKQKTIDWYRWSLGMYLETVGDNQIEDVTTHFLREYIVGMQSRQWHWSGSQRVKQDEPLTDDTINAHKRCLHRFWSWVSEEYSIKNPMTGIKYPKKPKAKPKSIPMTTVEKLFMATETSRSPVRDRAILAFLLDTGCRAGGLVGLRIEDVDLKAKTAILTEKGTKTRTVYFTEITAAMLSAWVAERKNAAAFFYNAETLERLTVSGLRTFILRLARRAGVEGRITTHMFRHSFAREYLRSGGDLSTLSRLMGHNDVTTTVHHYAIFTADEVREAHEKYSPIKQIKSDPSDHDESP